MHEGKSNQLFLKLDKFHKVIIPILKTDIKDQSSRESLLSKLLVGNISPGITFKILETILFYIH